MKTKFRTTRLISLILALIMVVGMIPTTALAVNAGDSVVVIAGSDYQQNGTAPKTNTQNILTQIQKDYPTAHGFLFGGDYSQSMSTSATTSGKNELQGVIQSYYGTGLQEIYVQGNHDPDETVTNGTLTASGAHDSDAYGVYVINEMDYPWGYNTSNLQTVTRSTANALDSYLDAKVAAGYTKPIFVVTHLPLHYTPRTSSQGDGQYAKYIYDVLDEAGENGLNIIFMFGHNHSSTYDDYLGGCSIYLPKGSTICVAEEGSRSSYFSDELTFTYMNCGYVGYSGSKADSTMTLSVFEITGDQVIVKRYSPSGTAKLKAAGVTTSGAPAPDTSVIGTEGDVIVLGEPEPTYTFTEGDVTVTAAGLTGLSVTKLFGTADTGSYDTALYSAYASYDIIPEGYTQGKTATVTVALDAADNFDTTKTLWLIDTEKGTEKKLTVTDGTVTFSTSHFSTYDIVQKITTVDTYELVSSITPGESYVIVGNDHPVALSDNNGTLSSQDVTISGSTLTSEEELTLWTFSSASSGTVTSANGNKLGYSSSSWNLSGSGDCTFDIATGSNNFSLRVIRASSGYNRYYFYYDGSSWAKNSGSTPSYVRLYQLTGSSSGGTTEPEVPETPETPEVPETDGSWIALPATGNTYVLDTDGIDSGAAYLIVAKSYAKALSAASSSGNAVDVTISGNTATAGSTGYGWTFTGSGSSYTIVNNGTYLGRSSSRLAAGSSGTTWTVSSKGDGTYTVTQTGSGSSWWGNSTYYVRWSNSNGYFQASSSSTDPVRLYKQTGSASGAAYARLTGETEQAYVIADAATESSVLSKLTVQTSTDGVNANASGVAVTPDMVTWDTAFSGSAAGTYTGTVSFEDTVLGTVTVTVTAEHNWETVTVDPTCTADGSVTTRCTVCGEETVEVIPATGHAYDCVVTGATCTEDGSKVYTCAVCADTYTEVIPAAGSHSYTSEITQPTCTEAGSVVYTCEVCADTYTEVLAATGHSYEAEVTAATCTADGFTTYTCETCGHSYRGETVPAFGHTYDSVVTATCTEDGYVVYTCETCGHSYTGEEVAAYGHSYETSTVTPTCTTSGYTTYVCKTCGYTCTGDETAALGHSYSAAVTEATCTEDGYTTYTCSACGHSYVGDHVAAPGHDYESVVTAPTYETEGYTTHTCKVCGDVKVDSYVPVLTHTYETVTVESTCTQDGSVIHTCIDCGYSYTEVLPALGHSWETVTVEAGCAEDGSITTTCTVCGEQTVEVIPATGHSYEVTTVAPTCTENGYTAYTCGCGHVVTEEISATGHSYESVYTAPTCTENGNTAYTCGNCGDVYTEVIPALGHSYESVSVAPTCTEAGFTTYSCTVCGSSYTADETPALGHSYSGVVTAPTCTEAGYTTYTCSLCAHSYVGNSVAALGHSYECTETEGSLVYTCPVCGDSYTERLELTYTKVSAFKADHNYVITLVSGNKYYALSHENNTVSAVRVTVSDNQITSDITEDLLWTYSDGKLSYESGSTTYFLYAQPANNWWGGWWNWWTTPTLTLSTSSSSSVSLSSNKIKVDSYYLRYSSSAVSLNSSGTTAALFIEE